MSINYAFDAFFKFKLEVNKTYGRDIIIITLSDIHYNIEFKLDELKFIIFNSNFLS